MLCAFFEFCALCFVLNCFAKDVNFELTVDRNRVAVGQTLELDLTFTDTQNIPTLDLPPIEGFQARYAGPSTRMSIVNGKASSSITHVYTLLATKEGTFRIGPFHLEFNNDKYTSNAIGALTKEENHE